MLAKLELFNLLLHPDLRAVPVLILANKNDIETSLNAEEVSAHLNLATIKEHEWLLQRCSALTGDGLANGLDLLTDKIRQKKK
jgi:ADP-ribosylation factor-like protein 5B